jgi:pimeloyl-ACP methyl ester carboxylesterase
MYTPMTLRTHVLRSAQPTVRTVRSISMFRGMRFIAQQLHARIPGSRLTEVSGADHIVNMSKPNEFNRIVLEFLKNQV